MSTVISLASSCSSDFALINIPLRPYFRECDRATADSAEPPESHSELPRLLRRLGKMAEYGLLFGSFELVKALSLNKEVQLGTVLLPEDNCLLSSEESRVERLSLCLMIALTFCSRRLKARFRLVVGELVSFALEHGICSNVGDVASGGERHGGLGMVLFGKELFKKMTSLLVE